MYIPTPAHQTYVFLLCIGFGFLLGIFYHVIRFIRILLFKSKKAIYAQDVIYCVISSFFIFIFLLCLNDGEIRLFVLSGFAFGLIIYLFTSGVLIKRISDLLLYKIRKNPLLSKRELTHQKSTKKTLKKYENKSNNT